ncbi:MAG: hypothetical protein COA49_07810 [Bacteroidetes bacterium]|nr:MAG: hypothetical protein COA49_07810 [Bacteroidota bacterium]
MKAVRKFIILFLSTITVLVSSNEVMAQFYDGLQVEYGKNRVQYREFFWQSHTVGHFEIYFYQGGHELAGAIAGIVDPIAKELKPFFGNSLDGPIQIIVYNNIAEFRQSNIGVFSEDEESENIGGTAKIIGNKIFLYGRGDRAALERDLRGGLARIALHQTIYKGDWQDALKNYSMLQIPDWFSEGLIEYLAEEKSSRSKINIFDAARSGALNNIDRSEGDEAGKLGNAVWDYIADVYGIPAIANVLYMVRISRSVEGGFRFATGLNLSSLMSEVISYQTSQTPINYSSKLPRIETRKEKKHSKRDGGDLPFLLKKRYNYVSIKLSPDGKTFAFITDERGQMRVWTCEINDKEMTSGENQFTITKRAQHGNKLDQIISDIPPPIAWHPDGKKFTYSTSEKGSPILVTVILDEKKIIKKDLFRIDEVLSMDYSPDGKSIVFSGMQNGISDLYLYRVIGNLQEPLWRDRFDDLNPRFTENGLSIIFSSNRSDEVLRGDRENIPFNKQLDIYLCHLDEKTPYLEQLVKTPRIDERFPIPLPNREFVYLSEYENGNQETSWGWADSTILSIDTIIRYRHFFDTRVISELDIPISSLDCDTLSGVCYGNSTVMRHSYRVDIGKMPRTKDRTSGVFSVSTQNINLNTGFIPPDWTEKFESTDADIRNYKFEFESRIEKAQFSNKNNSEDTVLTSNNESADTLVASIRLKPVHYRLNFSLQKLQSQVNNTFGSQFYRAYDGTTSFNPGLGNATEIRISDLFDDYHIIGGFNIPANLSNTLVGLAYYDLSGRVDKMISFQRQGKTGIDPLSYNILETQSHFAQYRLTFPVDEVRSLRASMGLRLDRAVTQGTEMFSLTTPNSWTNQIGFKLAWVKDNSRSPALNIMEGTRAKVWAEYYLDGFDKSFGTIGFDLRHYVKIYANAIIAVRAAGNWSIGELALLNLLGGTDNSLSLGNNYGTPIDTKQSYAYQANITPMRGFANNARNGSNAAICNVELRIPLWSTLFSEPSKTDFIRNLQMVGFADVGSAWTGLNPYSDDNTFNSTVYENNPITVTINNNKEPIIYDFGFGFRSRMFGYWVNANWGWGVDDNIILPSRFSLSLNFDF